MYLFTKSLIRGIISNNMKDEEKINTDELINSYIFSKEGKKINLKDVITKEECWYLKRGNKWILTHNAIKKIAVIAGISKNYEVVESANIIPDYKNELEHVVRVTIHCLSKKKNGVGCIHSDEETLTVTGEANRLSAPDKGRTYLRKMAEKRGFDIAVLEHLNLYSSHFSSEEEAPHYEKKREPSLMPGMKEFETITIEINAILNSEGKEALKKVGKRIGKGIEIKKYTDMQIVFLRNLYQREIGKKNSAF